VVVEVQVTPAYIKEQPQAFSIKAELRQDGLIHFEVTRHLSQPQYHVTIFRVRQGATW